MSIFHNTVLMIEKKKKTDGCWFTLNASCLVPFWGEVVGNGLEKHSARTHTENAQLPIGKNSGGSSRLPPSTFP